MIFGVLNTAYHLFYLVKFIYLMMFLLKVIYIFNIVFLLFCGLVIWKTMSRFLEVILIVR